MTSLNERLAYCLRAYKNAAAHGTPVPSDTQRIAESALREYDLTLLQDAEDADGVMRRITDPENKS